VQPNRGPEPFGLSVAEANALGTPVIAADLPALSEIILNQETGLLFRPGDSQHLSEVISRLLQDEKLRQQLASQGIDRIKKEFSPENHLKKTIAVYEELN
jgi:glycosyltransferase involved in cell wall biosynthesis